MGLKFFQTWYNFTKMHGSPMYPRKVPVDAKIESFIAWANLYTKMCEIKF